MKIRVSLYNSSFIARLHIRVATWQSRSQLGFDALHFGPPLCCLGAAEAPAQLVGRLAGVDDGAQPHRRLHVGEGVGPALTLQVMGLIK